VGYELRRMIRDGAPPEWIPLMRDVAKEIADSARDPDQEAKDAPLPEGQWPWSPLHVEGYWGRDGNWHDGLAEICGATPRAISDALTRLGRWGYEMRQPITDRDGNPVTDKRGRIVYAAKGHAVRLWVPPLPPRPEPKRSQQDASNEPQRSQQDATFGADRSHSHASNEPQRSHPDVPKVAPHCDPVSSRSPQPASPQKNQSPQAPVLSAVADAECGPAEDVENKLIDAGDRCLYERCPTPAAAVEPGTVYHGTCEYLAQIKARRYRPEAQAPQIRAADDSRDELPGDLGDEGHVA